MLSKLKRIIAFVCNNLVSMFIIHTFKEHLKLFFIVLGISLLFCILIAFGLFFNFITPASELGGAITWVLDSLMSFLDFEKVKYIAITYSIALTVNLLSEEMINKQTIREQILRKNLINELRVNTRAILITLTNGLSLIINLFIGIAMMLGTFIYFGSTEFTEILVLSKNDILNIIGIAIFFELFMLITLKWMVLPNEASVKINS
jgi:hypothetical protein